MRIYLDGVEYKTYREIMKNFGVRFGCLNFGYIWSRTPKFSVSEECSFLDEMMVVPGDIMSYEIENYVEFLNLNAQYISHALEFVTQDHAMLDYDCDVEIIPYKEDNGSRYFISYGTILKPFAKPKYKRRAEEGDIIHGFGFDEPWLDSMNTGLWMRGREGISSEFVNNKMQIHTKNSRAYFVSVARKLIKEGYKIDLLKVKQNKWKEIAKVNCLSWKKYQDYKENEWEKR